MGRLLKPPKGARCDFSVGVQTDSCGAPTLIRCPNLATVSGLAKSGVVREVWMCESCWSKRADFFTRRTRPA